MYFDPLCKCNETISPQAVQIVFSDFSPKKKENVSTAKLSLCILTRTQQYLSVSQAIFSPKLHTHTHTCTYIALTGILLDADMKKESNNGRCLQSKIQRMISMHMLLNFLAQI